MHCVIQNRIALVMGTHNWLNVWIVAEMLAMEVLLEVAASRESL